MRRYAVLIAEDEPAAQKHLKNIIEIKCPRFFVCGIADDGIQALEMTERLKPDLLISDIVMPKLDGMELIKEITLRRTGLKSIVLSGHQEFEYAKRSLSYGVLDYLLKPINISKLKRLLTKLAEDMDEEEHENIRKLLLSQLSKEQGRSSVCSEVVQDFFMMVIRENGLHAKYAESIIQEPSTGIEQSLASLLEEQEHHGFWLFSGRDSHEFVIIARHGEVEQQRFRDVTCRFAKTLPDSSYTTSVFAVRVPFHTIHDTLVTAYHIIRNRMVIGQNVVYTCLSGQQPVDGYFFDSSSYSRIDYWVQNHKKQVLIDKLEEYIAYSRQHMLPLFQMQIEISRILDRILLHYPEERSLNLEIEVEIDRIFSHACSHEVILTEIEQLCDHIFEGFSQSSMAGIQSSYLKIKEYIIRHLADDLSVPMLCSHFSISSSYLNKLFRRNEDQSVGVFVRRQRIERSIRIMRDSPNIPLKDIARMVGYDDPCYFSRIFKQEKGISARRYLSED